MQKFRRLKALFIKESIQIIRDPSAILIAVVLPLILLFLMGYAISLDSKNIPVGIVVEKSSKHTQSLVHAFEISKSFVLHLILKYFYLTLEILCILLCLFGID